MTLLYYCKRSSKLVYTETFYGIQTPNFGNISSLARGVIHLCGELVCFQLLMEGTNSNKYTQEMGGPWLEGQGFFKPC